ncbi:jg11870 [Pararge aegeria aegeria]|uniref:Jg11870 protein n=1 Tax=Pararge aegeria aegeria TaxID=348720 RepID=A0A8S4SG47_9NEOP|nr:jg11870 [Pararge aegeria aegeria]
MAKLINLLLLVLMSSTVFALPVLGRKAAHDSDESDSDEDSGSDEKAGDIRYRYRIFQAAAADHTKHTKQFSPV